jgi:hypothetical protein
MMKNHSSAFLALAIFLSSFYLSSCKKENLFRSESEIRKSLKGTWNLIPIPKYDTIKNPDGSYYTSLHVENWTFSDARVDIVRNTLTGSSSFTVHTTATKAEVKLEGVTLPLEPERYNGTWQIVRLDDDILSIANDKEGTSGIIYFEFTKKK